MKAFFLILLAIPACVTQGYQPTRTDPKFVMPPAFITCEQACEVSYCTAKQRYIANKMHEGCKVYAPQR